MFPRHVSKALFSTWTRAAVICFIGQTLCYIFDEPSDILRLSGMVIACVSASQFIAEIFVDIMGWGE